MHTTFENRPEKVVDICRGEFLYIVENKNFTIKAFINEIRKFTAILTFFSVFLASFRLL